MWLITLRVHVDCGSNTNTNDGNNDKTYLSNPFVSHSESETCLAKPELKCRIPKVEKIGMLPGLTVCAS